MRYLSLLLLMLTLFSGCDGGTTEPREPSMAGTWAGSLEGELAGSSVTFTASQDANGALAGQGNLAFGTERIAFTLTGTHVYPSVSFTARATGYEDINFQGAFASADDSRVVGTLNGSGFASEPLTLRRQ